MASNDQKWLIGEITPHLPEGFPTNREVLRVYFYHRLVLLKQKGPSIIDVAKQIIGHWKNLNEVKIIADQEVVRKMKSLIDNFDSLKKSMHRDTKTQINNERVFIQLLNECFNIAPKSNYHRNKIPETVPKLVNCKTAQQTDSNSNVDLELRYEVVDTDLKADQEVDTHLKADQDEDEDFETTLTTYQKSKFVSESKTKKPGFIHKIVNCPEVSSVLDRTNILNPSFTLLCAAIAGSVEEDLNQCVLSTSTIRRRRINHRDRIVTIVKNEFSSTITSGLVVHWDDDITRRNMLVERMAVVVTGKDIEKIITISKTKDGTGLVMSDIVYDHLLDWDILDKIVAICTDITSSNTGIYNGSVERSWRLMDITNIIGTDLDDLLSPSSMTALKSLKVDIEFMFHNDVSDWKNLDSYKRAKNLVDTLKVVNDTAERTLKLMTDINVSFTSSEEEKQRAIQVIEDNRKRIPSMKKSVLSTYKKRFLE